MKGIITFDILDYWHAGAGHGAGRFLDAVVRRSPAGLPMLPGRTVKGLIRKAMEEAADLGHVDEQLVVDLMGSKIGTNRFETKPGLLYFSDATLPKKWEQYAATEEGQNALSAFFHTIASTAIDEKGQAKKGALRRIEVAIPLTLSATWALDELAANEDSELADQARDALQKACGLIRGLGLSRTRGLGRARVSLAEAGGQ